MKVVWQANSHDKPREVSVNTQIEGEAVVKEMLEMGKQFQATWIIEPRIEGDK